MGNWGDCLKLAISNARKDVILVAPFITLEAFTRLFMVVPDGVSFVCVTRWLPHDISAGVTDIDIWPMVKNRDSSDLLLYNRLHAKYFRIDDECFVGSANITMTALGWVYDSNLELLVRMDARQLLQFEKNLLKHAFPATDDLYQHLLSHIELKQAPAKVLPSGNMPVPDFAIHMNWIPSLRDPNLLFYAYNGDYDQLTEAASSNAAEDLVQLALPKGLSKTQFCIYVGALLLQSKTVRCIDAYVSVPRRFGEVRSFLSTLKCAQAPFFDATRDWQTLMRWLLFFLPTRYNRSVPRYSEIFEKIDTSSI